MRLRSNKTRIGEKIEFSATLSRSDSLITRVLPYRFTGRCVLESIPSISFRSAADQSLPCPCRQARHPRCLPPIPESAVRYDYHPPGSELR